MRSSSTPLQRCSGDGEVHLSVGDEGSPGAETSPRLQRKLKDGLEGGMIEGGAFPSSDDKPMVITGFSTGYGGNSLAIGASAECIRHH